MCAMKLRARKSGKRLAASRAFFVKGISALRAGACRGVAKASHIGACLHVRRIYCRYEKAALLADLDRAAIPAKQLHEAISRNTPGQAGAWWG